MEKKKKKSTRRWRRKYATWQCPGTLVTFLLRFNARRVSRPNAKLSSPPTPSALSLSTIGSRNWISHQRVRRKSNPSSSVGWRRPKRGESMEAVPRAVHPFLVAAKAKLRFYFSCISIVTGIATSRARIIWQIILAWSRQRSESDAPPLHHRRWNCSTRTSSAIRIRRVSGNFRLRAKLLPTFVQVF